jgi:predicted naringenin-chalcone synthase
MYISGFQTLPPRYTVAQDEGLRWLAAAHAQHADGIAPETFFKRLRRFGCDSDQIAARGTFLQDFTHQDWPSMRIFGRAAGIDQRQAMFQEALYAPVGALYADAARPGFTNWIHVTCTGYASPSLVQALVSARGWGEEVQVLLVIQSLFADGVIRYRASAARPARGFKVEEIVERIAPSSLSHMTWDVSGHGFRMSLARQVPGLVQQRVAALVAPWREAQTVYAVHPGGPRIIDAVKEALALSEEQIYFSREVLRQHGNMSSATLPHVWQRMAEHLPPGTPVISLAFGPGLTLAASLMRAVGG